MSRRSQARKRAATRPPEQPYMPPPTHGRNYYPRVWGKWIQLASGREYEVQDDGSWRRLR